MSTKAQQTREKDVATGEKELPEGWADLPLLEVGEITTGGTPPRKNPLNFGRVYPWVKPPHLDSDEPISDTEERLSARGGAISRLLPAGSVMVSCIGNLGKVGFAATTLATNQQINSITFTPGLVNQRYGYYYCKILRPWLEEHASATTIPIINKGKFSEAPFLLAPLAEQERIAELLGRLETQTRSMRDRLVRIPRLIKHFRNSVLAAACSGKLTEDWRKEHPDVEPADAVIRKLRAKRKTDDLEIVEGPTELPGSWAWVAFGSLIEELRNGISTKPEIDPPGKPILRISAVRSGRVTLDDYRYLRAAGDFSEYRLRDCDLLFTRYNGSLELLGVCGMVRGVRNKSLLYPDKLMRARFDHPWVLPAYAEIFFGSPQARDRITEKAKSSAGQQGVSGADVKAQPFSFPPTEEQKEIVRRVEALFKLADAIEKRVSAARVRAERLTQAILAKAFRGELVPTEAELARREGREYEPASVLLDRIKAERKAAPQKQLRRGKKIRAVATNT